MILFGRSSMFCPPDERYTALLNTQAKPLELAACLPGRVMHLRSLAQGLRFARNGIMHVMYSLAVFDDSDPSYDCVTVSADLTSATMFLQGVLDGRIFCELPPDIMPARSMNFQTQAFHARYLQAIQDRIREYKSFDPQKRETYTNFWTIANFWKHCMKYQPRPEYFSRFGYYDFKVELGSGASGPVMRDLIIPVFNGACDIVENMSRRPKFYKLVLSFLAFCMCISFF